MFKHILVAIDGSDLSMKAADLAIGQARLSGAKVTFIHVARKFPIPDALKDYIQAEHLGSDDFYDIDDAVRQVLDGIRDRAKEAGVARVETVFREGKPSRTLVDYARNVKADCIVMGCRGITEIEGMLLGSVAHKVASLAPCTVILAR
jgi:nucleotide-binding universal stress UspA family protein